MKVLKHKKSGYTVSLEFETTSDEIEVGFERAFKSMVKHAKVPGFRPGKVPRSVFEKHYGRGVLVKDGLTEAVNTAYIKVIDELNLDVIDFPKDLEIGEYKENTPIKVTCSVDVKPDVKLGKYKGIKLKQEPVVVDEKQIEDRLLQFRENSAEYKEVERPIQTDDIVRLNMTAQCDGTAIDFVTRQNAAIKIGAKTYSEDFDKELIGKKVGDTPTFSVTYLDDFQLKELAGKTIDYSLEILEVREKSLPALSDELIAKFTEHQTVEAFRSAYKESLEKRAKEESEDKLKHALIEEISANCKVDIPNAMIETEINNRLKDFENTLRQSRISFDQYCQMTGKTLEDFKNDLRDPSQKAVQNELIINAIIKEEAIDVTDEDIHAEIQRLIPSADTEEKVKKELQRVNMDGFKVLIQHRKAIDFLLQHAKIS